MKSTHITLLLCLLLVVSSSQAQLKKPTVQPKKETTSKPQVKIVEKVKIVKENNDKDNDGIIDGMDECPDQYGRMENRGCPDSDGDGIVDSKDKCPYDKGEMKNEGCPDSDGDGIVDSKDKCPNEKGVLSNDGCPPIKTQLLATYTETVNGVSFKMVGISGGTFTMGSSDGERDEKPTHRVTLSNFYMGATEVTQSMWQAVMGNNPSNFKGNNLPVESVSWDDCQSFISKLNQLTGKSYRLPTEAEWEYAAGGGEDYRTKYAGTVSESSLGNYAWYGNNSGNETHNVGGKSPNRLGLYDMSGNVWEWCSDWYGDYSSYSQNNPTGASSGSNRVLRGGSWYDYALLCRSAFRNDYAPDDRYTYLGLRLVSPK